MSKIVTFALALLLACQPGQAWPQTREKIVFAINPDRADSFVGRLLSLMYTEAFRQLNVDFELRNLPPLRATAEVEAGIIDGEAARTYEYANLHPNLVRVEEASLALTASAFSTNPSLKLNGWDSLKGKNLRVEYRAGYPVIGQRLETVVPKERLSVIGDGQQGLKKLAIGRTDLYIDLDEFVVPLLQTEKFKRDGIFLAGPMESGTAHAYLLKRHADLALRLGAVLRKMKANGTIDRFRERAARSDGEADSR